jgi:hypothetical protein
MCARVVTLTPRASHITPVLKDLHWLPVKQRVEYKVLVHVYRALNGSSPQYITDMIRVYHPRRSLRSGQKLLLHKPAISTTTFGARTFPYVAATLWNDFPDGIKSAVSLEAFRSRLKTHLFATAY